MKTLVLLLLFLFVGVLGTNSKTEIEDSVECEVCIGAAAVLDFLLESNASQSQMENVIAKVCLELHQPELDEGLCRGIVKVFGPTVLPILVYDLVNPRGLCKFLGYCSSSTKPTSHVRKPLDLPPKPSPLPKSKYQSEGGYILQLSDIHWDDEYTVGSIADCVEPLCCRPNGTSTSKNPRLASRWGDYHCDINELLLDNVFQHLATLDPPPNFVVWTGDTPPHDVWAETAEMQLSRLEKVSAKLFSAFPNIPIFPAIGNHDTFPVDQFNRKPVDMAHHDDFDWLTDGLAKFWSKWLPQDAIKTLQSGGYYTTLVNPGLRLISINSQWADGLNFYLLLFEDQQQEQLNWFIQTLTQAEADGEKVIIIAHIPPVESAVSEFSTWTDNYIQLVNRFSETIVGQFYGHTHKDEFQLITNRNTSEVSGYVYIAPSLTPFTNLNPSYRMYQYDSNNILIDYKQYIVNLSATILNDEPSYELEYSAKSAYGLPDLSPKSWANLVQRFQTDDNLFQKWYYYYHKSFDPTDHCDSKCKGDFYCYMTSNTADEYDGCYAVSLAKEYLKE